MNGRRQRLAWFILLGSFFLCVATAVAVPLSVSAWVQGATRPLTINVQANQGTVGVLASDTGTGAIFAGDPAQPLDPGETILTNATDTALVIFAVPEGEPVLARLQVYGNSSVTVVEATAPRFSTNAGAGSLALGLTTGRILLTILPAPEPWPLLVEVNTPQGIVKLDQPGQYSVIASNVDTQVAVLQGQAEVAGAESSLVLGGDQRAILPTDGSPTGPLDSERNLIANGDFNAGTAQWVEMASNVELADQPPVAVTITQDGEEQVLTFYREGIGHADVGLRQLINQDLTDYESLRLAVTMRVRNQSLGVCGQQGSECPLIIRIEYVDANGVSQTWQQGFYAIGEVGEDTPDICITCAPPYNEHLRLPFDQLVFYESDNLLEQLALENILPRQIKVITLVSSGHTFHTEVLDVALMAKE